ncbi:MAG: Uma2 family endonuclease [Deltaproteobacteria bacterium]|nr:Uma2 family endonuclease [Deltaproteobacteria bacterium]
MTAAEYLEWEKQDGVKPEYVAGEVFAMSGASDAHVTLSLKLASMLLGHLAGGPCGTKIADMKVNATGRVKRSDSRVSTSCLPSTPSRRTSDLPPVLPSYEHALSVSSQERSAGSWSLTASFLSVRCCREEDVREAQGLRDVERPPLLTEIVAGRAGLSRCPRRPARTG